MSAEPPKPPLPAIVSLFGRRANDDQDEEVPVGLPRSPSVTRVHGGPAALIMPELADQPKVWFVSGPGRSGATMLLRYVMEVSTANGGTALAAALNPQNRSLASFIYGVEQPPNNDSAMTARWLEELVKSMIAQKQSGVLDLGCGDTSLSRFLSDVPDLSAVIEASGVAPVAIYTLGPRIDDLASLASFEARGFTPRATALVLNEGLSDPTIPREEAFGRLLRHSAYKAALDRGAVQLWMPRLDLVVVATIEANRLSFAQARDGISPKSRPSETLGVFDRSRVRAWMIAMDAMLAPIRPWLP